MSLVTQIMASSAMQPVTARSGGGEEARDAAGTAFNALLASEAGVRPQAAPGVTRSQGQARPRPDTAEADASNTPGNAPVFASPQAGDLSVTPPRPDGAPGTLDKAAPQPGGKAPDGAPGSQDKAPAIGTQPRPDGLPGTLDKAAPQPGGKAPDGAPGSQDKAPAIGTQPRPDGAPGTLDKAAPQPNGKAPDGAPGSQDKAPAIGTQPRPDGLPGTLDKAAPQPGGKAPDGAPGSQDKAPAIGTQPRPDGAPGTLDKAAPQPGGKAPDGAPGSQDKAAVIGERPRSDAAPAHREAVPARGAEASRPQAGTPALTEAASPAAPALVDRPGTRATDETPASAIRTPGERVREHGEALAKARGEVKPDAGTSGDSGNKSASPATANPSQTASGVHLTSALELAKAGLPGRIADWSGEPAPDSGADGETVIDGLRLDRSERGAELARAASTAPHSARILPAQVQTLAARIAQRFNEGTRVFDIRIDPPELGRVEVRLEMGRDNRVNAILTAERPEALAELQRAARDLEKSLAEAGLDLGEDGLSFQLADQNAGEGQSREDFGPARSFALPAGAGEHDITASARPVTRDIYGFSIGAQSRLDLSV